MKKLYITPFTMMMNVELQKVIAASKDSIPVNEDYTETNPNSVASRRRRRSVWDDEEEMEEEF